MDPIGIFHCDAHYPQSAARQGVVAAGSLGTVEFASGRNFEQAIQGLEGFDHIWLLFQFDRNTTWTPLAKPPRGNRKVGVFACRSPYRPNGIGLSCVELVSVTGRMLRVRNHDLLDGTPILDIKPYIPYSDSIPDASEGWLADVPADTWTLAFAESAKARLDWLENAGVGFLKPFIRVQLSESPTDAGRKRVTRLTDTTWEAASRTWRIRFDLDSENRILTIVDVRSGYTVADLAGREDRYHDKDVHRRFTGYFAG